MKRFSSRNKWLAILIAAGALLALSITGFFILFSFRMYSIPAASMEPTLNVGDRIVVRTSWYGSLQRGDMIVFAGPKAAFPDEIPLVKRVIGLPGETLSIKKGGVYANNHPLSEPYLKEPNSTELGVDMSNSYSAPKYPFKIPTGHYFVMGDNRADSFDSRFWGTVEVGRIRGKVVHVFHKP